MTTFYRKQIESGDKSAFLDYGKSILRIFSSMSSSRRGVGQIRTRYSNFGCGAVVLIMDKYEDLDDGKANVLYASRENLMQNDHFATFATFIKKVDTCDPGAFTVLFVFDRHSARFYRLSLQAENANSAAVIV